MLDNFVISLTDDILNYLPSSSNHIEHLRALFKRVIENNLSWLDHNKGRLEGITVDDSKKCQSNSEFT